MAAARKYGPPEPSVVDEALILTAVEDADRVSREYGEVTPNPALKIHEITKLALSFKNLHSSANLGCLDSLVELRLDNNSLTKIEHLSHLVNLTWLDLSFNNISVIEGLDTLTKLTDLSLFNNKIKEIGGLSTLKQLECLSLGNNQLSTTTALAPLRSVKTIKSLNLSGNPVCSGRDYRPYCIAYLKNVLYLDYVMIDVAEIQASKEVATHTEDLTEANEKEILEGLAAEQDLIHKKAAQVLQNANIAVAETLLDDLIKDDAELAKLRLLPGVQPVIDEYRDSFRELSEDFKTKALEANGSIVAEVESFQSAVAGLEAVGSASAIELISVFQRSRKHALKAFQSGDINNLSQLRSEAEGLNKSLLHLEMKTNEQIEELFEILETSLNELRLAKLTIHQGFFRSMEAFEGRCNDSLLVIAEQIIKLGAEDSSAFEHLTDDLNLLARDRDTLITTITGSHDQRVSVIIGKEDELILSENRRCATLSKEPRYKERQRNRDRITEISELISSAIKEIDELEEAAADEEED